MLVMAGGLMAEKKPQNVTRLEYKISMFFSFYSIQFLKPWKYVVMVNGHYMQVRLLVLVETSSSSVFEWFSPSLSSLPLSCSCPQPRKRANRKTELLLLVFKEHWNPTSILREWHRLTSASPYSRLYGLSILVILVTFSWLLFSVGSARENIFFFTRSLLGEIFNLVNLSIFLFTGFFKK